MKNNEELRSLSEKELQDELLSLRKEQFNLRLRKASGSLSQTHLIADVRNGIARVKTIMSEKVGKSHVK